MVSSGKSRTLVGLVPLFLAGVHLARAVEEEASGVTVTGTKWDLRSSAEIDEFKGCFTDGCSPELLLDGILNDELEGESRWSCTEELEGPVPQCYVTFDVGSPMVLTKLSIWFFKSDDVDRDAKPFSVSTSLDDLTYRESFEGVNTPGTELGVAEDFAFPEGWGGRFVRVTSLIPPDEWLSINEIGVFVDQDLTPAPTAAGERGISATMAPTSAPTSAFTASPTVIGGDTCQNITVSNAGDLTGDYYRADGATNYASTGDIVATISAADREAVCADSTATGCSVKMWQIRPEDTTLPTFLTYDEAVHPSAITEVWLRLDSCTDEGCTSTPADVLIVCGDGSTAGGTLAPAAAPADSTCGVIEVVGTADGASDGFYYDDGSDPADTVTQYTGYDEVNGELTSNGNKVMAQRVDSACAGGDAAVTSDSPEVCSWRQWWVEPTAFDALDFYTFDEASHPADIAPGSLWFASSEDSVMPYDGEVTITCAPAATPALPPGTGAVTTTPSPAGGDGTRSPLAPGETEAPAAATVTDRSAAGNVGGRANMSAMVGGVAAVGLTTLARIWF